MRYDAFISYRHSDLDMFVAKKVHKGLETFKVPRSVKKKTGKKKIKRVFRDQEELPIGSDLGNNITSALAESEYLLVICSPRTPESYWVQTEIATFIQMHGREHVLAILVEGKPNESFPQQLLVDEYGRAVEPLAADVRGKSKKKVKKKLQTEIMRLAAPILGCTYDDLRQRHKERRIRKFAAVATLVAVLGVAFGAYSAYNTMQIQKNYKEKQINQSKYLADTSLSLLESGNRKDAILLALEALPSKDNDRPYVPRALYALSNALYSYDMGDEMTTDGLLEHDIPVKKYSFNDDATRLVSVDNSGSVYVWNLEDNTLIYKIDVLIDDEGETVETMDATLVDADTLLVLYENRILCTDLEGKEIWSMDIEYAKKLELNNASKMVAVACLNDVYVLDARSGEEFYYKEETTGNHFDEVKFSKDGTKLAISRLCYANVSVVDIEKNTEVNVVIAKDAVKSMFFADNNSLLVSSVLDSDEYDYTNNGEITATVEMLDLTTNTTKWQNTFQKNNNITYRTEIITKFRGSSDNCDAVVMVSVDRNLLTFDPETGALRRSMVFDSNLKNFYASTSSEVAYACLSSGKMVFAYLDSGRIVDDIFFDAGTIISEMLVSNSVIVARAPFSPNLIVMKYHEGYGKEDIDEYEDGIWELVSSPKETYYALRLYDDDNTIEIHKTSDDSIVGNYELDTNYGISVFEFISEDKLVAADAHGCIFTIDIKNDRVDKNESDISYVSSELYITNNHRYLVRYDGTEFEVVDFEKNKTTSGAFQDMVSNVVVSEDGKWIYAYRTDGEFIKVEVETENETVLSEQAGHGGVAVSTDGKRVAVAGRDNYLYVFDTQTNEVISKVSFASYYRSYLKFSEDGNQIILQGDDYYLRVYDIDKNDFVYLDTEQINKIDKVIFHSEQNNIYVQTSVGFYLLDASNYEKIAYAKNGIGYLAKEKEIFAYGDNTLSKFPYMDLEALIKQAKELYGNEKLSEQKRIKYNVE